MFFNKYSFILYFEITLPKIWSRIIRCFIIPIFFFYSSYLIQHCIIKSIFALNCNILSVYIQIIILYKTVPNIKTSSYQPIHLIANYFLTSRITITSSFIGHINQRQLAASSIASSPALWHLHQASWYTCTNSVLSFFPSLSLSPPAKILSPSPFDNLQNVIMHTLRVKDQN